MKDSDVIGEPILRRNIIDGGVQECFIVVLVGAEKLRGAGILGCVSGEFFQKRLVVGVVTGTPLEELCVLIVGVRFSTVTETMTSNRES